MNYPRPFNHWSRTAAFAAAWVALHGACAWANPQGGTVKQGEATITQSGPQMRINVNRNNTVIDWRSFNIGAGETTTFMQPNSRSVVWNRINDSNPSQILGNLNANGFVVLMNQNGFYFGKDSVINVGGFLATAAPISQANFGGGSFWQFNGPPPTASIINYGQIQAGPNSAVYLVAEKVENHGAIMAPDGTLGLYAGKEVLVSERPDGRGLSAKVALPEGSVDNTGKLIADAGTIALHASVVNQNGLIQANSVKSKNGVIELVASDSVNLGSASMISANGGEGVSAGGKISIKSDRAFTDDPGSQIQVRGGAQGGNGGAVELCATEMPSILSQIDGTSRLGFAGGRLFIDPYDITLGTSGTDTAPGGNVGSGDSGSKSLKLNVNSAFKGFSTISLQAQHDITLASKTTWDLSASTGKSSPGSLLTLEAGNNINLQDGSKIVGTGWSVQMAAGADFSAPLHVKSGVGGIYLNGNSAIQTGAGAITLRAGNEVVSQKGGLLTGGGNVDVSTLAGDITLSLNANANSGGTQILLDAGRDLYLSSTWNLADSGASLLTLRSGRNIIFKDGSHVVGGKGWAADLAAVGGIYLNGGPDISRSSSSGSGSGSIETTEGSIDLQAGSDVIVGQGFVRTDAGGNISVKTTRGDIDSGFNQNSFVGDDFTGLRVDPTGVGGIATVQGGNIRLDSGRNIASDTATVGCYGAGDLALFAKGEIDGGGAAAGYQLGGGYMVRNGKGTISAGSVGNLDNGVSLALASGSWNVIAAKDIFLREVFNVNGSLNSAPQGANQTPFNFDYATDASVKLSAGNSVQLLGSALKQITGKNGNRIPIYPPKLDITAGAGGIVLGNDVVLYPSAQGHLNLTTLGSLTSANGVAHQILMSDSDLSGRGFSVGQINDGYSVITYGHSLKPLHLPSADDPVVVDVKGNIENVKLLSPKSTTVTVGGDAINFFLTAQNLLAGDVSSLTVTGDIKDRSDLTAITLRQTPDLSIFDPEVTERGDLQLASHLFWNAATHQLVFRQRMTADQRDYLLNPTVRAIDPITGKPAVDINGQPVYAPVKFLSSDVINQLYTQSQDVPAYGTRDIGLFVGGPGKFIVSARNMDLGVSGGIRSLVSAFNPNFTAVYRKGADIRVDVKNNLEMASSQIASFSGGAVTVNAGGQIDVGSKLDYSPESTPKGIYTGHGGAVTITAQGNINVSGSRIATYDGGDVMVTSLGGSVDAGDGGKGYFNLSWSELNPVTGKIEIRKESYFGSGIMAFTGPKSDAVVGNITITAAKDITANSGGVLQLAFNHSDSSHATVALHALGGNIDANRSGILGQNLTLDAAGEVRGLAVAQHNIDISGKQGVSITALGGGQVSVSSSEGSISGTIIGGEGVNVASGVGTVSATVVSASAASGSENNAFKNSTAPAAEKTTQEASETVAQKPAEIADEDSEDPKKKASRPLLAKSTGRVTVILPKN